MIQEALAALAAAGGSAVVQAAGTDAWTTLRAKVAEWFGRGETDREQAALRRLDISAAELTASTQDASTQTLLIQEAMWRSRIQDLLEGLDGIEQDDAARHLQTLLDEHDAVGGVSAESGGLASGRDTTINAHDNSIAAGVLHGGATVNHPPHPAPSQG